jgi:hypothetical protein
MPVLVRGLAAVSGRSAYPVLYLHPYELDPEPLRAALPPSPSGRQRFTATTRSLWRNAGRALVAKRLRELSGRYRLLSYEEAYDDIAERYGIQPDDVPFAMELRPERVTSWRGFAIATAVPRSARRLRVAEG